jgi:hypothetical protein
MAVRQARVILHRFLDDVRQHRLFESTNDPDQI